MVIISSDDNNNFKTRNIEIPDNIQNIILIPESEISINLILSLSILYL